MAQNYYYSTRSQHTKTKHNSLTRHFMWHTHCFLFLSLALLEGILHSLPCLLASRVVVYVNVGALWEGAVLERGGKGGDADIADLILSQPELTEVGEGEHPAPKRRGEGGDDLGALS